MDRRNFMAGLLMVGGVGGAYRYGRLLDRELEGFDPEDVDAKDPENGFAAPDVEAGIATGVNELRASEGRERLSLDDRLGETAREHSRDMFVREFVAHENPDGEGPADRARCDAGETLFSAPIERQVAGPNAIYDTTELEGKVAATIGGWESSHGHRETILLGRWQALGVGVIQGDGEFLATAMFC
jgi:uncharacterized protein YkwD